MSKTAQPLTKEIVSGIIKPRPENSHKGDFGHALLLAGDKGRMGAAVMAAEACLRSGAGLLSICVPEGERFIVQITVPEAMLLFREEERGDLGKFSAAGAGPAIGVGEKSVEFLKTFLQKYSGPLLLDADALTILSQHKDLWELLPAETVITPHPKEFDRLFGPHSSVQERMDKAIALSRKNSYTIVLKGHHTLIASNGVAYLNETGNAGLAKGGSGDVLSGMITSLLAQGYNTFDAAKAGVYLHGSAADIAIADGIQSVESLLASDVIACIGEAFIQVRS